MGFPVEIAETYIVAGGFTGKFWRCITSSAVCTRFKL